MRLIKLKIINLIEDKVIREIKFNQYGLSLIVDETDNSTSGSNIGKTTAVKVIDLCLGAKSITSLYKEKDTGENNIVKEFLEQNKILAELHIRSNNRIYILKRPLYRKGKPEINGQVYENISKYNEELNKIIFNNTNNRPSFRKLITKFIRLDNANENSLLKYLGFYTKQFEYQAIYEYLYGIDTSKSENIDIISLNTNIDKDIGAIYRKNGVNSKEEFETKIKLLEFETQRLKVEYQKVSIVEEYEDKEEQISELMNILNKLERELAKKRLKVNSMKDKIEKEKQKIFSVDHKILKRLYDETGISLNKQLRDFEELEEFHNGMVNKRIEMLEKSLMEQSNEVTDLELKINKLRKIYENNYVSFNSELREVYEEKVNEYSESKIKLENAKNDFSYIEKKENEKTKNLSNKVEGINNIEKKEHIVKILNKYFREFTIKVIGEPFAIVLSNDDKEFPVKIIGMNGKPGTGIKKAMITCFDLAHIGLIMEECYDMPVFEIHDKLESIDLKELKNIVELARNFNGQYIFPILKDRISETGVKDEEIILRLSKEEKFFLI